jgi:hypothetical protein
VAQVAISPSLAGPATFDDRHTSLQRFGAGRPKCEMAHPCGLCGGEFERVMLVVVPPAQVDRLAATRGFGHAHDVDKEVEALVRLGCEYFQVTQVGEIERSDCRLHSLESTS